jgi:hypothetical protein
MAWNHNKTSMVFFSPFDGVRIILGVILLAAALLKGYELAAGSVVGTSLLTSPGFRLLVVAWELLLGLWLFAAVFPRLLRWTALVWFTLLLGVALSQAAAGVRSCACFGFVEVAPWLMVVVDLAAVAALWSVHPIGVTLPHLSFCTRPVFLLGFVTIYWLAAIAGAALVWKNSNAEPRLVSSVPVLDLGTIPQGGYREASFWLTNDGNDPVEIASVESSCSCLEIHLAKSTILPGQTVEAIAKLDVRREPDFTGELRIETRGRTTAGLLLALTVIEAKIQKAVSTTISQLER